jgi:hypothetical protein
MKTKWISLLVAVLLSLLLLSSAQAQAGGFSLTRWTVDNGGGVSQGGGFSLIGTLGQPDSGLLKGGSYLLSGGFWRGEAVAPQGYTLHLPLITR